MSRIVISDDKSLENLDIRFYHLLASEDELGKLHLFMSFANGWDNSEVPDPYYGGGNGFERVFDMVQSASEGLLEHIMSNDLR